MKNVRNIIFVERNPHVHHGVYILEMFTFGIFTY